MIENQYYFVYFLDFLFVGSAIDFDYQSLYLVVQQSQERTTNDSPMDADLAFLSIYRLTASMPATNSGSPISMRCANAHLNTSASRCRPRTSLRSTSSERQSKPCSTRTIIASSGPLDGAGGTCRSTPSPRPLWSALCSSVGLESGPGGPWGYQYIQLQYLFCLVC